MKAGNEKEAISLLNKVIDLEPNTGKAYYALYTVYAKSGESILAMKNLKESFKYDDIDLKQKLQSVTPFFSEMKRDKQVEDDMIELSNTLLEQYPGELEPYMFRADIHGTLGEYTEARTYVRKALSINNTDYQLWNKLITLNDRLKDNKQQIADTDDALEIFPNITQLYAAKGYAHLGLEENNEAIAITEEGLNVAISKEDKLQLLLCQASAYGNIKNYAKSDKTYDKILKLNPYSTNSLNNYSYSLANRKIRLDEADSMINIALRIEPSNPFFLDTKAWVLFGKKEYQKALKILDKCMEISPNNTEYYEHAKAIFLEMGNETMANDMQEKIDKINEK